MRIDEMPAGRECDALIAEKVMGYTLSDLSLLAYPKYKLFDIESGEFSGYVKEVPHYSTDIAAALPIAEKLKISLICSEDGWYAVVTEDVVHTCNREPNVAKEVHGKYWALADTIPLAICRAALKALGVTEI